MIFKSLYYFHSFLQDSLELNHDELNRGLQNPHLRGPSNGSHVDMNPMEFIEQNGGNSGSNSSASASTAVSNNGSNHGHIQAPQPPPFELDFDKFDMLSEFPDLDHYNSTNPASTAMIHHGASGPLLSSAMAPKQQQHTPRHNITDYNPDWAWSEVSTMMWLTPNTNIHVTVSKIY